MNDKVEIQIDYGRVLTTECAVVNDIESGEHLLPGDMIYIYCHERPYTTVTEWLGTDAYVSKGICAGHALDLLWHSAPCEYCKAAWEGRGSISVRRMHAEGCPTIDPGDDNLWPRYRMTSPYDDERVQKVHPAQELAVVEAHFFAEDNPEQINPFC